LLTQVIQDPQFLYTMNAQAVDGWAVTVGTSRKELGGAEARPSRSSLYRM